MAGLSLHMLLYACPNLVIHVDGSRLTLSNLTARYCVREWEGKVQVEVEGRRWSWRLGRGSGEERAPS